jgi:hypothetical protein
MKKARLWAMALAAMVAFSSCEKEEDDDNGTNNPPEEVGIQGEWQSSGAGVAPLLVTLFGTDSIYADFNTDMTYTVEQYDTAGTALTLSGTYTQTDSGTDDIWTITVDQTSPASLTSEGIFKVDGNTMQYEIVQTSPDIGATPPTPAGGFGSTNAGALGMANVQTYQRVE